MIAASEQHSWEHFPDQIQRSNAKIITICICTSLNADATYDLARRKSKSSIFIYKV